MRAKRLRVLLCENASTFVEVDDWRMKGQDLAMAIFDYTDSLRPSEFHISKSGGKRWEKREGGERKREATETRE